jgi:hypothetical protein
MPPDTQDRPYLSSQERRRLRRRDEVLERQAHEAGCFGLVDGYAFSERLKRDVSADDATHDDGPFICRGCLADAVLRKCTEKIHHYAHHARTSPTISSEETALHHGCLDEILACLKSRFPQGRWEKNRAIPENKEYGLAKVVPDISGRLGGTDDQRLVIEAQVSFLTLPKILKRCSVYTKRRIPILWIVPLKDELGLEPFRPRLFERYLHSIYFGRVYYWRPGFGTKLLPVHYGLAERHIPYSEWFDVDNQEEREAGGFNKPYKIIKTPVATNQIDLVEDFHAHSREEFRPWNERKKVPALKLWKDKLDEWWDPEPEEAFRETYKEDTIALS